MKKNSIEDGTDAARQRYAADTPGQRSTDPTVYKWSAPKPYIATPKDFANHRNGDSAAMTNFLNTHMKDK